MVTIIGLLTFILVLTLPLLLYKLLPRTNPTTLIAIVFFTALVLMWVPFFIASPSPITFDPYDLGILVWLYYPFSAQPAPNDHSILLIFGLPFQEYLFRLEAVEIINFLYTFTALAGITIATYIHAKLGGYPLPQYPTPLKPIDGDGKTAPVAPLPWDYRIYCIMATIVMIISTVDMIIVLLTFSTISFAILPLAMLCFNNLAMLMTIHLYWKIGTTDKSFSAPLMSHYYTLGLIFLCMGFALMGTTLIPYDPRLKPWVSTAAYIYLGLSTIFNLMGHATGPRKWGILDD